MKTNKLDENTLSKMLHSLHDVFVKERRKGKPYKELFKAGSTHTGLLRALESKMNKHVLDACDVYKEIHGIDINRDQYHVLLALPFLVKVAEMNIEKNEGKTCCVDKAYFLLSEQLKALSDTT